MTLQLDRFPIPRGHRTYYRDRWNEPRPGGRQHKGVDVGAPSGTPIVAALPGRVLRVLDDGTRRCGFGAVIRSGPYLVTYCHMRAIPPLVEGEPVAAGDALGFVGESGDATAPHLHFQVQDTRTGAFVNAYAALRQAQGQEQPAAPRMVRSSPRSTSAGWGWLLALLGLAWWGRQ